MGFIALTPDFSVSPQLTQDDVVRAAREGFRHVVDCRPDNEEPGQPSFADVAGWAEAQGMTATHVPATMADLRDDAVDAFAAALAGTRGNVLGYCKTGRRASALWALSQARTLGAAAVLAAAKGAGVDLEPLKARILARAAERGAGPGDYDVVIVGGGSGGIAAAASLLKRRPSLAIAIVEPAETHYYQPGFTLVGAGVFTPETTRRPMASVMPSRAKWVKQAVAEFAPDSNEVVLADGSRLRYRALVASPGIKLDWEAIPGLVETLGKNGVTSNYRADLAPYTHQLATSLQKGRALFTQPPMPIKCAGAPQKAMYLSCDTWRRAGVLSNIEVEFHNAGAVLFGVPAYVPALMKYVERYGINLCFESKLVAVDGAAKVATFEEKDADGNKQRVEREFAMLHAVPPQKAPEFIATSPLAGETGFIAVDPTTLRHTRYPNIFALGDGVATTNAKTAAAARKQAPVIAINVLSVLDGKQPHVGYDGYGSCPLTVERGKIVLAEFGYGGKLLPSFPGWLIDGTKPSRAAWFLKERLLPPIYWNMMLEGQEWLCAPHMLETSSQPAE
ncbi:MULTISPECIES: bifunctional protein tyrosine phosphatase family protein/NAD(P)/FAD-dependent oxidoreductase [Methylosinus]|uniref:TIGR01244 family phosphatase n=1 Tax=Methylosinus trichosporium (strain ATCC 35070 / NCIMB 11131 / UNIQEM 75 / OB3b) TaxID=595536 RepID=A0A2D2CZW1_METT3|nr:MULTISPECIES: bifunctional protein tyrosine phosphatase family protein/NAD(P)/FAD-dependent oxidoreductase [Methylosinus]ATQ68303.1 TIGR01244 family phosphatase [Methylosinus trichosporium OB3b]OBS50957.1 TIGR01244 family protein [Methylosinus sp. 3S-1]